MIVRVNTTTAIDAVGHRLAGGHEMSNWYQHRSNPAKRGPARDPVPPSAPPRPPKWRLWLVVAGVVLTFSLLARPAVTNGTMPDQNFSFTDFVTHVDANQVKTATVARNGHVSGTLANGDRYTSQVPTAIPDSQLAAQLQDDRVEVTGTTGAGVSALGVIVNLLPLLLLVGFFVWISRRGRAMAGGINGVGRAKARVYGLDDRPATRFADVAGYQGAKQEVTEVVDFLKHPGKYRHAGAVGPRGVPMVGPPGTGKTLMARVVAGEAAVPFWP
jgi:cell division protease FtsH